VFLELDLEDGGVESLCETKMILIFGVFAGHSQKKHHADTVTTQNSVGTEKRLTELLTDTSQ
jgi:hypothetical protein